MIYRGSTKVSKIYRGSNKIKAVYKGANKVWSGSSVVSYYDGNTLMGTETVDGGEDVLHPSISTSKEGYTLYGWGLTQNATERQENLVATGEPMTLYAIYVANSITVVTGSITPGVYPSYSCTYKNTEYVNGEVGGRVELWYKVGSVSGSYYFTLDKKHYQTATVTLGQSNQMPGSQTFDGNSFSNGNTKAIGNGSHVISLAAQNDSANTWAINAAGITSLVLSNPIEWE